MKPKAWLAETIRYPVAYEDKLIKPMETFFIRTFVPKIELGKGSPPRKAEPFLTPPFFLVSSLKHEKTMPRTGDTYFPSIIKLLNTYLDSVNMYCFG